MNKVLVAVFGVSLALSSCGSDGDSGTGDSGATQSELADLLVAQGAGVGFDEQCIRDKTDELSDQDAQFLIDNIDVVGHGGVRFRTGDVDRRSHRLSRRIRHDGHDGRCDVVSTDASDDTDAVDDSDDAASSELVSIERSGFSTWTNNSGETWASAAALVTNDSDQDLFGTEVTFNFVGADGVPVATESTYVDVIPAGESFPAQLETYTDLTAAMPITIEIVPFAESDSFFETEWIELELGSTTITSDEYFSNVSGTVTNPSDDVVRLLSDRLSDRDRRRRRRRRRLHLPRSSGPRPDDRLGGVRAGRPDPGGRGHR